MSSQPPPGKVLAVDPGERRIGFAISDPERKFSFPLTQLTRTTPERDAVWLKNLVAEERVVLLVVGLPVLGGGEEGSSAGRARDLGTWMGQVTGLPLIYHDESYSTRLAERKLWGAGLSHARRKERRDAVAAQGILEAWIEAECPGG
ncbi:MAG: Holliday junction resolvase RuvX [Planctomycetota bacterium]|nr:Holliday junction resolvase RuvX [Planctomycetota bacterium]RLS36965.1 MAG: Holliday junction resolvase RuvX [Planctomycetota bacterium]